MRRITIDVLEGRLLESITKVLYDSLGHLHSRDCPSPESIADNLIEAIINTDIEYNFECVNSCGYTIGAVGNEEAIHAVETPKDSAIIDMLSGNCKSVLLPPERFVEIFKCKCGSALRMKEK